MYVPTHSHNLQGSIKQGKLHTAGSHVHVMQKSNWVYGDDIDAYTMETSFFVIVIVAQRLDSHAPSINAI